MQRAPANQRQGLLRWQLQTHRQRRMCKKRRLHKASHTFCFKAEVKDTGCLENTTSLHLIKRDSIMILCEGPEPAEIDILLLQFLKTNNCLCIYSKMKSGNSLGSPGFLYQFFIQSDWSLFISQLHTVVWKLLYFSWLYWTQSAHLSCRLLVHSLI